jgi:hypothetical protein
LTSGSLPAKSSIDEFILIFGLRRLDLSHQDSRIQAFRFRSDQVSALLKQGNDLSHVS